MRSRAAPTQASLDRQRSKLVGGARRHFFSQGFRAVSMDDLAAELRMSKRTFYALFPSKRALLQAVLDDKFADIDADLQRIAGGTRGDVRRVLGELVACLQRHVRELQPPILRDLQRQAPDLFDLIQQRRSTLVHRYFEQLLRDGQREGLIRDDVPAEVLIQILLGAIQQLLTAAMLERTGLAPRDIFSFAMKVFMDGALARQGGTP